MRILGLILASIVMLLIPAPASASEIVYTNYHGRDTVNIYQGYTAAPNKPQHMRVIVVNDHECDGNRVFAAIRVYNFRYRTLTAMRVTDRHGCGQAGSGVSFAKERATIRLARLCEVVRPGHTSCTAWTRPGFLP